MALLSSSYPPFFAEPGNRTFPTLLTSFLQFKSFDFQLCSEPLENTSYYVSFPLILPLPGFLWILFSFPQLISFSHKTHSPSLVITLCPSLEAWSVHACLSRSVQVCPWSVPFCLSETNSPSSGRPPACSLW